MLLSNNAVVARALLVLCAGLYGASSFSRCHHCYGFLLQSHVPLKPSPRHRTSSYSTTFISHNSISTSIHTTSSNNNVNWVPQDLTKDNPGFLPIPSSDYIKKYQANPKLWPVEFFIIAYRHLKHPSASSSNYKGKTTQILVRKSANGTSKYGVGTGVPVTRWMLSTSSPPKGYTVVEPEITFDASNFPEFKTDDGSHGWRYSKIDICEDAFQTDDGSSSSLEDEALKEYAGRIRQCLQDDLSQRLQQSKERGLSDWDINVLSTVKSALDNDNSAVAIQGSFRMSGLFAPNKDNERHVNFDNAPDPTSLAKSTRIYTMFPQMPDPMPSPTSTPDELKNEILSRPIRMHEGGRDPHKDKYGRVYTHISTSNVSNTIHGVYITFDTTDLLPEVDDVPPAYDLFGMKPIDREWVSLEDLKVMEGVGSDGQSLIGECDTKSEFISGFIARELVRDGVIGID